jgi:hypothetical protein
MPSPVAANTQTPEPNTYFPSAKVRLIVRFDEFAATSVQSSAPKKPTTVLRGLVDVRSPLVVTMDPNVRGQLDIGPAGQSAPAAGNGQSGSSDGLTWVLQGIIPKKMTWNQNGIRTADTLSMSFKFIDCPVDPRTIRSCAVEAFLGTVSADDYAAGVGGQTRSKQTGGTTTTEPLNIIPDSYVDEYGRARTNLRFQGWVDKWTVDWSEDEEPTITFECRDNTQLLIDVEVPAALVISAAKPLDAAIADYLSNFPNFSGLSVQYLPTGTTAPVLGQVLAGTAFQPQLGPAPARGGGATAKLSVWDYLTDVCGAVGHNVRVVGTTVVVEQVQTLLNASSGARADDPFTGRTQNGDAWQYRRFILGRNIQKLNIGRNFSKHAPTNVEVRSYSPRRKKTLVVRFPDPGSQLTNVQVRALPGDGTTDQKWLVWKVRGVEDAATLSVIAQNVYQQVGRTEFGIDLTTRNMASFGGDNLDPDLFDMLVGDTFELLSARDGDQGVVGTTEDDLLTLGQQTMEQLGFDPGFAAAYAKAYVHAGFQTLFRLRQMSFEWDGDGEGVTISVHGTNYVEVRVDPSNFQSQGGS